MKWILIPLGIVILGLALWDLQSWFNVGSNLLYFLGQLWIKGGNQ